MHHTVAIFASLASLGLAAAIYYCNILSRPNSRFRGETLAALLFSLLTGLFPIATGSALVGLTQAFSGGFSIAAVLSAGADLIAIGAVIATVVVLRRIVRATYRGRGAQTNVTPLNPVGPTTGPAPHQLKRAA